MYANPRYRAMKTSNTIRCDHAGGRVREHASSTNANSELSICAVTAEKVSDGVAKEPSFARSDQ